MKQATQSILLATLLLASGFASAQNPTVPATRAEVKSEIGTAERDTNKPIASGSTATQGNTSGTTRAQVKSETGTAERDTNKPIASGSTATQGGSTVSAAEKKRMRDERRAAAKANRDAKMKSGSTSSTAPASEKAR